MIMVVSTLIEFSILLSFIGAVNSIATNRINLIEERPLKLQGAVTSGGVCDSGFTITPMQKESTLTWDLGDIYILHEITLNFAEAGAGDVIDEVTAAIGFADSNFFTNYKQFESSDPKRIVLRPHCFKNKQWGASGSTLKMKFRTKNPITIGCLEAMGVLAVGKNVMVGKPVSAEISTCKNGLHFLNDIFEDGHLNYQEDPLNLMVDLGKVYKPTELEVSVDGPWEDGTITLMPNYYQGNEVTSCKELETGKYKCPLTGEKARYVAIEGEDSLPKFKEIRVNV